MSDSKKREEDSFKIPLVERRAVPRAPVPGLSVKIIQQGPLANQAFELGEFGLESLFVEGDEAEKMEVGKTYRMQITFHQKSAEFVAECLRVDKQGRIGAVVRIIPPAAKAKELLEEILKPAGVPRGPH